jgi:methyl halide transferase
MNNLDAHYWNYRFETHDTAWDIGRVSPPLKQYFDQLASKDLAILIPGCGNAYEADYLQNGFTNITLVDISSVVTRQLGEKLEQYVGKQLSIITGNFFELKGAFDLVVEQTFFCATEPALRILYAKQMHKLLKEDGRIAGLLFNRVFASPGPPFGGSIDEYEALFSSLFHIKTMEPCYNSIEPRAGTECFFIATKRLFQKNEN